MDTPTRKSSFALFFGNRGFFPALMASAREGTRVLNAMGHEAVVLMVRPRYGAVETPARERSTASSKRTRKLDGVILSLLTSAMKRAVAALRNAGVPILIQAYPDEMDKMAPETRRDAFCGKVSIMDVFCQNGIPFTALKPHTVAPSSARFAQNVDHFDRVCRVVKGMRNLVVGAVGARTTAFKTVRIDELALQRHGITMETFDLSDLFARMRAVDPKSDAYRAKEDRYLGYTDFSGVPGDKRDALIRLGVALDTLIEEARLDTIALRCWEEMQRQLGISPCVVLSEMNDRSVTAACEVDVGNAVAMHALGLASGEVTACLDWNNNYEEDDDKCILFHCGPVPQSMMTAKGKVEEHAILANAVGRGCSIG